MPTETGDVRIENAQAYDAIVDVYAQRTATLPEDFVAVRERFIARLDPGARVADIGCGPGA